jgi:hypothetical protein
VSDEQDVAITRWIPLSRDPQFDLAGAVAHQDPGVAVRTTRDFDRKVTHRFTARPDLTEVRLSDHL